MKLRMKTSFLFLLTLALGLTVIAQTPSAKLSPVGTWTGTAENMGSYDAITVVIEKKGDTYTGKINDVMGMFPDSEIKNFVWKGEKISFEFPGAMGDMSFNIKADLALTEKTLNGTWTVPDAGLTGAIELTRK